MYERDTTKLKQEAFKLLSNLAVSFELFHLEQITFNLNLCPTRTTQIIVSLDRDFEVGSYVLVLKSSLLYSSNPHIVGENANGYELIRYSCLDRAIILCPEANTTFFIHLLEALERYNKNFEAIKQGNYSYFNYGIAR